MLAILVVVQRAYPTTGLVQSMGQDEIQFKGVSELEKYCIFTIAFI
ncbi:hypothetical protein [Comamonas sp. Tr-654]|nr:hypothetical protein [Comamonas sp. Tr-654]